LRPCLIFSANESFSSLLGEPFFSITESVSIFLSGLNCFSSFFGLVFLTGSFFTVLDFITAVFFGSVFGLVVFLTGF
jgi:hypothetical protein